MNGLERVLAVFAVAAIAWLALETHEERIRLRRQEQAARDDQSSTEPEAYDELDDQSTEPEARDELAERRARHGRRSA